MDYIKVKFTKGLDSEAYQEISKGSMLRYLTTDGIEIPITEIIECIVIDTNPERQSWMIDVENPDNIYTVEALRNSINDYIDYKTQEKIFEGFMFDGKLFSLSISAQINWSNLFNVPDVMFPLKLSTKDDNVYDLTLGKRQMFYLTALSAKTTRLQVGSSLKQQAKLLTSLEELTNFKNSI